MRWLPSACVVSMVCCSAPQVPYQNARLPIEKRLDDLVKRLTDADKRDIMNGLPVARLSIPALPKPGPVQFNATALAATWDPELMSSVARGGSALDVRDLGDDPWLASRMTVAWVSAVQANGSVATLRGFPNDETLRQPFRAAVEEAGLWCVDAGAEAIPALDGWGFRGFVTGSPQTDDQVRRRLRALFGVGAFDPNPPSTPEGVTRNVTDETVVLLKNDHNLLPLAPTMAPLAVIGGQIPGLTAATDLAHKPAAVIVFSNDPAFIRSIAKTNSNVIVVIDKAGLPQVAQWIDTVPAAMVAWGSNDLSRILLGQGNPSGRLPVEAAPFHLGHGLSYTTFTYKDLKVFPASPRYGQLVTVTVRLTNAGNRAGAEVVQVYLNDPKQLKAFRRVELNPGDSQEVSFELDRHSMSVYDPAAGDWAARIGVFHVTVGGQHGTFQLYR